MLIVSKDSIHLTQLFHTQFCNPGMKGTVIEAKPEPRDIIPVVGKRQSGKQF